MSYATMPDVLFALEVDDSELRDRRRRHADVPAAEPELPEQRSESAAEPKTAAEMRRAA